MRLDGEAVYNIRLRVIHAPDADDTTPDRDAPPDLPRLDREAAHALHPEAVATDGCSLIADCMDATPYLSARTENPLWRNAERGEAERFARDLAYAQKLNALGIDYPLPQPVPDATKAPFFHDIPENLQSFFERGIFQWDWPHIFEVAKMAKYLCTDLPIEELENWKDHGDENPRYDRMIAKFKAQKADIQRQKLTDKPGWWERFSCDHIPSPEMRTDVQLHRWNRHSERSTNSLKGAGPFRLICL